MHTCTWSSYTWLAPCQVSGQGFYCAEQLPCFFCLIFLFLFFFSFSFFLSFFFSYEESAQNNLHSLCIVLLGTLDHSCTFHSNYGQRIKFDTLYLIWCSDKKLKKKIKIDKLVKEKCNKSKTGQCNYLGHRHSYYLRHVEFHFVS